MLNVAVRKLCEFSARRGDLDYRYTPAPSAEEGISAHRKLQRERPPGYRPEYPLAAHCSELEVRGRVDGLFDDGEHCYLEEIKSHRGELGRDHPGQRELHWAQLKVYGALYCQQQNLDRIRLRLCHYDIFHEQEHHQDREFSAGALQEFLSQLCTDYLEWGRLERCHRQARDVALADLRFPFSDFRQGQRELAENVYKAIATGRSLMLQAPTGLGKTLGVLYPALSAMPRQNIDRLVYLTSRNTGRQLALDALTAIDAAQHDRRDGQALTLRVLELTAREQACEHPELGCHGDSCPLAKGFFDRLAGARSSAIAAGRLDRECLRRIALAHHICPYYLGQEMARWCDVIVADVNLYFDQQALLHALTIQQEWKLVTLIDEAHNLIDRGRSMYSGALQQAPPLALVKSAPAPLIKPLKALIAGWRRLLREQQERSDKTLEDGQLIVHLDTLPTSFSRHVFLLCEALGNYLADQPAERDIRELLFETGGFLKLLDAFGEHSLLSLQLPSDSKTGKPLAGSARLTIRNLIPADKLATRFASAHSSILFSATLAPANYYRNLLGLPDNTVWQEIASPFHRRQVRLRLVTNIDTRYRGRANSIAPICERIARQYHSQPGNYLVYLSSYAYLQEILQNFTACHPDVPVIAQLPRQNNAQRQAFLDTLRNQRNYIAFAVMGGVFGEGIDLPGDALIGVFVATLGLPPHDEFHRQLERRLEARFGTGYHYTYLYPGLRKVIQAAGRLIRTPEDAGIIELIDPRYRNPDITGTLPGWWS